MFYPQVFDSPKSTRKMSDSLSRRHSRESSPSSSPSSSPKTRRRSRKNSAPSLAKDSSPLRNSTQHQKREILKQLQDDIDDLWSHETDKPSQEVKQKTRNKRQDSTERRCASPYFQLGISFPLSPNNSRSSSPCNGYKDPPTTHPISPLVGGVITTSDAESEEEERDKEIAVNKRMSVPSPLIKATINNIELKKTTPPKKPPRTRSRSSLTTPLSSSDNGLGGLVENFPNSQRFRPYAIKEPVYDHTPPILSQDVTDRLADLESSLDSSLHGNNNHHSNGIISPFPFKEESSFCNNSTNSEREKTSLSPPPPPTSHYPWRNIGGVVNPNSILLNDLEYSLEPRRWGVPKVTSPPPPPTYSIKEEVETNEETNEEMKEEVKGEVKEEVIKETQTEKTTDKEAVDHTHNSRVASYDVISINKDMSTEAIECVNTPSSNRQSPFVQIKHKTPPSDDRSFLETGVYDKLLPLSPGSPLLSSSPNHTPNSTSNHASPNHTPNFASPYDQPAGTFPGASPVTTPTTNSSKMSPSSSTNHKLIRRQSEDVSELTIAYDRRMRPGKEKGSSRRLRNKKGSASGRDTMSTYENITLQKRDSITSNNSSVDGTEDSLNWKYIDPASYDKDTKKEEQKPPHPHPHPHPPPLQRKSSIFGGLFGEKHDLYNPKNATNIQTKYLARDSSKINLPNEKGDTPLHCYIKSDRVDRVELVLSFLVHCNSKMLDINPLDANGDTPLHVATKFNDEWCIKVLLSFGADINSSNGKQQTPLDLVTQQVQVPNSDSFDKLHELLSQLHAIPGGWALERPRLLDESLNSLVNESYEISESVKLGDYLDDKRQTAFVFKLEELLDRQNLEFSLNTVVSIPQGLSDNHHGTFFDGLWSRDHQLRYIRKWKSTIEFSKGAGCRMLFLDGGGIRGLIQIEILKCIEKTTGRKITELFDWIIGSSTGGIIALCLVYLNMSLEELRQLYFQLREEVFVGGVFSISKLTEILEQILRKQFQNKRMCDVDYPKVLISAVSSRTSPPELHFFNNCFNDHYSDALVWKVARYTSAGPTYFTECDDFLDGGVLANNPCTTAWVEIMRHHEIMNLPKPKVAMAISVGTGSYPREILGETDLFGKGWLDLRGTFRRAHRFIKMLSTALVESENVAKIFATTCKELDIKFLRFSPSLTLSVKPDETDYKVLLDMIIHTQIYLHTQSCKQDLDKMVRHFRHLAELSRGLNLNK